MNIRFLQNVKGDRQASARIRIITPSQGFQKLGFDGGYNKPVDSESIGIIHKCSTDSLRYKPTCKKIIWDVCDNYFYQPHNKAKAYHLLESCDAVTTATEKLKGILQQKCDEIGIKRKIFIVDDPVYYKFKEPTFAPKEQINVTWYGNDGNLSYADWDKLFFQPLLESDLNIKLNFMNQRGTLPKGIEKLIGKHTVKHYPWSIENQEKLASKSDFIILPIDHTHEFTVGKSHNKLVDGLACGTMVLASPQDSYLKFSDYAYIGNNFVENITHCINNLEQTKLKIEKGQQYINENLSSTAIAQRWIEIAKELYHE